MTRNHQIPLKESLIESIRDLKFRQASVMQRLYSAHKAQNLLNQMNKKSAIKSLLFENVNMNGACVSA